MSGVQAMWPPSAATVGLFRLLLLINVAAMRCQLLSMLSMRSGLCILPAGSSEVGVVEEDEEEEEQHHSVCRLFMSGSL